MLDEIGAEGLIPPVEGVCGLEEEVEGVLVVHEATSTLGWVSQSMASINRIDGGR
jgi:hypothetical protein